MIIKANKSRPVQIASAARKHNARNVKANVILTGNVLGRFRRKDLLEVVSICSCKFMAHNNQNKVPTHRM